MLKKSRILFLRHYLTGQEICRYTRRQCHTIPSPLILSLPFTFRRTKRITIIAGHEKWKAYQWANALLDGLTATPNSSASCANAPSRISMLACFSALPGCRKLMEKQKITTSVEVYLQYPAMSLDKPTDWPKALLRLQAAMNNYKKTPKPVFPCMN